MELVHGMTKKQVEELISNIGRHHTKPYEWNGEIVYDEPLWFSVLADYALPNPDPAVAPIVEEKV